ncbi:PREDICTED: agamous-like MADS-box protein AGL97 [Camelina sativa]|uniref:Agamous-like MADS-box protein AGL97 n=1 Tax=Camelina sativa TaxID=90675 RepID=A0ABM0YJL1_CAMSA|nr:PREDICTED: agamous-like MADS-box protein AGL97 [Camelina sativa]
MVKKGGMKRKIAIKKIIKKSSQGPICVKRRNGLFSKAAQLCLLSGAQVAVLATPSSSESNVSFNSFGHSTVDGVVSAFLSGQRPVPVPNPEDDKAMREDVGICLTRKNLGLGFWWNNERLIRSENPREISDAIDSMWTLLGNLKELRADEASFVNDHEDLKKNNEKSGFILERATQEPDQTLNHLQSICTTSPIIPDVIDDQSTSPDDDSLIAVFIDDLPADTTEEQDQIFSLCESFCITDNNNNNSITEVNLDFDQELGIDQLIDYDTNFESSLDEWYTHQEIVLNLDQCFPYIDQLN